MKNNLLAAIIENSPVGIPQADPHIPAASAFPDIDRELVDPWLENSAVQLLAVRRGAAAGADQRHGLLVHINPDRIIAGRTHPHLHRLSGCVLDIGRRHRHDVVVAREAELPDHRIEIHKVGRQQVRTQVPQKVNAYPGGNLADLRVTKPAAGLSQGEINIPFLARTGILFAQVVGSYPVVAHDEGSAPATAGGLVKEEQVPGVGLDPSERIHSGGKGIQRFAGLAGASHLSEGALGFHIEDLALEIIVFAGSMKDKPEIFAGGVIQPDARGRIDHSKPEIPATAAFPDIDGNLVHAGRQLGAVPLLAVAG